MSDLKIALIYFSATNVTRTYAEVIQDELLKKKCEVKLFDMTSFLSRQKSLPLDHYNGFIFGFFTFGGFFILSILLSCLSFSFLVLPHIDLGALVYNPCPRCTYLSLIVFSVSFTFLFTRTVIFLFGIDTST